MTDQEFSDWLLRDGASRCVLVELDYQFESGSPASPQTGTLYFSDREYFDASQANAYTDCINSVPHYSRALGGNQLGSYTSSIGTLEIDNADGAQDLILGLAIDGSAIRFYLGDTSWPASDFRLIFSAFSVIASAPSFDRISITLKDTGVLLDQSIGGAIKIGGTGPNADQWRPVNFGLVHQVECMVLDQPTLVYVHSDTGDGLVTAAGPYVMTIRDKGVPVVFTDNGDGTVTLLANPAGTITADLLYCIPGPENEYRCVSDAMSHFVGDRVGLAVLGLYYGPGPTYDARPGTGVKAWLAAGGEDYQIGISIADKRNILDLLGDLTDSGLCFWAIRRDSRFTFGRLRPNYIAGLGVASSRTLTEDDIDQGTLRLDRATPTYFQLQATMSKNWSVQTDLAASLSPDERAAFTRSGLYAIQDNGVGDDYANAPELYNKTLVESPQIDTLLSGADDATDVTVLRSWMETRLAASLPWLTTASMTVGIDCYDLELGDVVTLALPRFGYDAGVEFQLISTDIKLPSKIDIKLLARDNVQSPYGSRPTEPPDGSPYSGPARILLAVASLIAGAAFATSAIDGMAVGVTFEATASFVAGSATGNGTRGGEGGFSGGGSGGGSGSITSITATAPISVTPDPITATGVISHDVSGVTAATYGDGTHYPIFDVDADGHLTAASQATFPVSGVLQCEEFIGAGTYTFNVPAGVSLVWLTEIAAGGGGSTTISGSVAGGAGGSGELAQSAPVAVTAGGTATVIVGAGGPGGAASQVTAQPGSVGGDTSFDNGTTVFFVRGGNGGATAGTGGAGGGNRGGNGGAVGSNSGALGTANSNLQFGGSGGGGGASSSITAGGLGGGAAGNVGAAGGTGGGGGGGGSSFYGVGAVGANGGVAGANATAYGTGGSGSGVHATTTLGGGNGADGYVLVAWVA
ncbi:MAG: hypothetical protein ACRENK_15585 [Gemmatimonadaceae bacterium]